MRKLVLSLFLFAPGLGMSAATNDVVSARQQAVVVDTLDVAPVWAGHPVGFALLTQAPLYLAFCLDSSLNQMSGLWLQPQP
jgi:hypothetical protein